MPLESYEFTRWQAWVNVAVKGGSSFMLPVSSLSVRAVPFAQGSPGATAIDDVNNRVHYVCDGWRHNVRLTYMQVPEDHHATIRSMVQDLHANGGVADISIAGSDGTVTSKTVTGVADFSKEVIPAEFDRRVRRRPVTLRFKGQSLRPQPHDWLTN